MGTFANYTDLAIIENFGLAIFLYFPIKNIIHFTAEKGKIELLTVIFLITVSLILFKGILYSTGNGIHGDMYNSTYFSNYITLFIPLLNLIVIKKENKCHITFATLIIFVIIIINIFNHARAATLTSLLYILINNLHINLKKIRLVKITTFILILLPISAYLIISKLNSVNGRLSIWQSCLEIFIAHPMGIGLGNLKEKLTIFQSLQMANWNDKEKFLLADINDYAFNDAIQFIVEGGCIILIALIFISILVWKNKSLRAYILYIFMLSSTTYILHSQPTIILIIITFLILNYNEKEIGVLKKNSFVYIPSVFVLLWSSLGLLSYVNKVHLENTLLDRCLNAYRAMDNKYRFDIGMLDFEKKKYQNAIYILKNSGLLNQDINANLAIGYSFEELNQIDSAEKYYNNGNSLLPRIFKPKYFLFNLYKKNNDTINLKRICLEIINTPVKIKSAEIDSLQNIAHIELIKIK
ncbi:O-antigen ligase family protein [Pedobacter mendelii]|uniref:O-antigen ligase-related domain-containing protein n=1 Tax=Pedobacter mendelii TaxID=1908240 RepID=A0ABQ2BHT7_9SPHI|nr:O-antigen ligase family protein [Pedobacter mendelii]GGI26580.1 hypothetical protein GCM10008119_23360 [Pedobacter mendelii]